MNACETRQLLQATAQGLLTLPPDESHDAIAGLIRLIERAAESEPETRADRARRSATATRTPAAG